jgi:hypothetical protein
MAACVAWQLSALSTTLSWTTALAHLTGAWIIEAPKPLRLPSVDSQIQLGGPPSGIMTPQVVPCWVLVGLRAFGPRGGGTAKFAG